jgi:hypothetical protein
MPAARMARREGHKGMSGCYGLNTALDCLFGVSHLGH